MLPKALFNPKNQHADRDIVFHEDFSRFYDYIDSQIKSNEAQKSFSYSGFKSLWKEKKMSLIHFIKSKEESIKEFYEVLYGEIQKFLFSEITNFRVYSVFTLYSIYFTQPYQSKYQINTIPEALHRINEIISSTDNIKLRKEFILMMSKLYQDDAFSIGSIIGVKSIILNKYGIPVENKFHTYKNYLEVKNNFNFVKDCKTKEIMSNAEKNIINYSMSKKVLVDEIKSFFSQETINPSEVDNYCKSINNEIQSQYLNDSFKINKLDLRINEITNLDMCLNQTENYFVKSNENDF